MAYLYCRCQQCWYWSVDDENWHRDDVLVVQSGDYAGKRPNNAALETIAGLKRCKVDPHPNETKCPIGDQLYYEALSLYYSIRPESGDC